MSSNTWPTIPIVVTVAIRNGGLELLPHWLRWYADQCRPCTLCILVVGDIARASDVRQQARSVTWSGVDVRVLTHDDGTCDGHNEQLENIQQTNWEDGTWVIWTDLDELHEMPGMTLRRAVEEAARAGQREVYGYFIDHHAPEGELKAVQPLPSLFEQFPLESRFSRIFLRAYDRKVVAATLGSMVTVGHHEIEGRVAHEPYAKVHHFKWTATMVQRIREWGAMNSAHSAWAEECERLSAHLQQHGGRIKI